MEILPIKSIRDEDGPLVGSHLVNLGKLFHLGLPVADGVVVIAPEIKLKSVLEHFHLKDQEVFEQSLTLFRSEVRKIEIPAALKEVLKKHKIDPQKIWHNLLENWTQEIRSRIFREGFSPKVTAGLSAQPVFFTKKISTSGEAYFDDRLGHSVYKLHHGTLSHEQIDTLDQTLIKVNKKLFIPQNVYFVLDESLKIVKVNPYTPDESIKYPVSSIGEASLRLQSNVKHEEEKNVQLQNISKSSVKVFLDLSDGFAHFGNVDGIIISGEKISEIEMRKAKMAEVAAEFNQFPVIYKLPDLKEENSDLRGALKLIHSSQILKNEAEGFLAVRNKKRLFNLSIAVPFLRNINELLQIKRDLASMGISRKGMLKLWVEFAVPENIINAEEYILAGFDGAIINLDSLAGFLSGFNIASKENTFTEKQIGSLLNFLEDAIKLLRRSGIPIILSGNLALHDETLNFLFEKGIYGILVDLPSSAHISEQLKFAQFHHIKHKNLN